ncbi:hypothetical protein J8C01_09895 [Chloracidobacterium sp. D]|uniref:hypothetical protein n=1 Tax=Chloracidobacterium sp. D TaxID=2821536 RepID=UPI001B8D1498|nr:hypothetical protein [Chloracidobacterium sp. D]QUV81522.1 hypothetical protein J8C01_09895 [Chloracidobacterium sp. D]
MGFNPRSATPPTPRRIATDEYRRNDTISRPHGNAGAIVRIHHESGHPRWGSAVADATGTIGGRRDPWVETHGKILLPLRGKHAVATHDQRPRPRVSVSRLARQAWERGHPARTGVCGQPTVG